MTSANVTAMNLLRACLALLLLCFCLPAASRADETLPDVVRAKANVPLVMVGTGVYRRFGFSVYRATFWTPDGTWNKKKPYALELRYMRDLSKDTLMDAVSDDLTSQNVADEVTLARWHVTLNDVLSDVKDGDTITSLHLPGKASPVFHNNKIVAWINDEAFINAFFNIWLGPTADDDMRTKLLGKVNQ